ncbi:LysR family transcriptional regulator [Roseovarius sp. SCSIO 43702]|uniref:LysR substrate-binding domain-containing protein n=1 Tax=Roseovarius sp. SCSIO 43702 TaxID=2823043 RepID=UPI001C72FD53|nr:LysR substrate-binding domain-containing protein [Roseovarius sp. SCSIO 43702]QYX55362.1 LysR family transcriptional regulator [Roseovarius sp. SCSIO 43702]
MNYSQLKAFHNVALHGGFSRAAEALLLTQPAISEQVRKLEQENDVLLFSRERKRVRLTREGEALFLLTRRFFEAEEQIREHLSQSSAAPRGELRIIADAAHHVTDVLSAFRKKHPGVHVTLRTGNSEEVLSALRSYEAEIGVLGSPDPGGDLEYVELGATSIVACVARDLIDEGIDEMTLAEIARWPLVFRERGSKTRAEIEAEAERQGVPLIPMIEVEGREAMREVVASGAGIGFVSEAEFGQDARLRRITLKGVDLRMSETLVYLAQRSDVRVIRAFMEVERTRRTR